MELPDTVKTLGSDEDDGCKKKDESINIDIALILGKLGGKPPHHGEGMPMGDDKPDHGDDDKPDMDDMPMDDDCVDWKSLAKQLMQTISMLDTATDAGMDGDMDPKSALQAADQMTSRALWGKQEEDNPMSMYQNANYTDKVAAGFMMENPAVLCNNDAYGDADPDHDGDVDFNAKGDFIDTGKDEPHPGDKGIGGFKQAADAAIKKQQGKPKPEMEKEPDEDESDDDDDDEMRRF